MAIMAATVWFIPGWLRTAEPHEGILECVSNAFPEASVEFKSWDGDNLVWPLSVDSADKESWRFAFEIAMMPPEARTNLKKRIFVDTNVLLDVLLDREGFYYDALKIWANAELGKVEACIAAISLYLTPTGRVEVMSNQPTLPLP